MRVRFAVWGTTGAALFALLSLTACGGALHPQPSSPTPVQTPNSAAVVDVAIRYAKDNGLLNVDQPLSVSSALFPAKHARAVVALRGVSEDPFASANPKPSDESPVWVISMVESVRYASPGSASPATAIGVTVLVDYASTQVLWAKRTESEVRP